MSSEEVKTYTRHEEDVSSEILATVQEILRDVARRGDEALREYTVRFDGVDASGFSLVVSEAEYEKAREEVRRHYARAWDYFVEASERIARYHERQKEKSWFYEEEGAFLGQLITPLDRVGVYVPGGRAFYPSSVLMNVIPARIAGVNEIYLATPPDKTGSVHPLLLALAEKLGVKTVFKMGGAQAIAALAYGTETVPAVHKITGPGNAYVAMAKRLVQGRVAIDSVAGPSEVAILADDVALPEWIAMDLCAQAEHSPDSVVFFLSLSRRLLEEVEQILPRVVSSLPRREIIEQSLKRSYSVLVSSYEEGFELLNRIAPEHAEVILHWDTAEILSHIRHMGALFVGPWTPVAMGDYFAGPNHVIPTYGTAVYASPLGVYDFVKRTSVLRLSEAYMQRHGEKVMVMAELEGLHAHGLSARYRTRGK